MIVVVQVGSSSENICSSGGGAKEKGKKERQDETQFITKIDGKTSLGPHYFLLQNKISFSVTRLMPYYAETGASF
jgi:hypothetical protein